MNSAPSTLRHLLPRGLRARATAPLRGEPDYLIIGAMKCGTTTLYDYLVRHPMVSPARVKEVHYFDLIPDRSYTYSYRIHFPRRGQFTGEASTYLYLPEVPARVAARLPDARLVVLLRDPVARAVSHYHHSRRAGREPLSLADALEAEESRMITARALLNESPSSELVVRQLLYYSYKGMGRYAEQLTRWLEHFSPEQLLVLSSERFFSRPNEVYSEVLAFLGLPDYDPGRFEASNAGTYSADEGPAETYLRRYFAPHNDALAAEHGIDFGWHR